MIFGKKPKLNKFQKETLALFQKWFEKREELNKKIKTEDVLTENDLLEFKKIVDEYIKYINDKKEEFEKKKIKYKIQLKYLDADLRYINNQLQIKKKLKKEFEERKEFNNK